MKEKVILAYSGGLDTTTIIPWLKETYDYDVVCVCIDVGQEDELDGLEERAKLSGACKLYIEDVVDEFVDEYVMPCVPSLFEQEKISEGHYWELLRKINTHATEEDENNTGC